MTSATDFTDEQIEAAIEAINSHCQSQLEYEESDKDAGDGYAHMPREGDTVEAEKRLVKFCAEHDIPTGDLDPDELIDAALDNFRMIPGTIYGMRARYEEKDYFTIDTYPVQEIEISLEGLGLSSDLLKAVTGKCEPHISDKGMAYLTTDAVWHASIHKDRLKEAVADLIDARKPNPTL